MGSSSDRSDSEAVLKNKDNNPKDDDDDDTAAKYDSDNDEKVERLRKNRQKRMQEIREKNRKRKPQEDIEEGEVDSEGEHFVPVKKPTPPPPPAEVDANETKPSSAVDVQSPNKSVDEKVSPVHEPLEEKSPKKS